MIQFEPLDLSNEKEFNTMLTKHIQVFGFCEGSEYCFANLYAWRLDDRLEIYTHEHFILIKGVYKGKTYFLTPIVDGENNFSLALKYIYDYCNQAKTSFILYGVSEKMKDYITNLTSDLIPYYDRDLSEYVYQAKDLIQLSGKKYHAKRNFVTRFLRQYDYEFRAFEDKDKNELIHNLKIWDTKRYNDYELDAISNVLDHLFDLNAHCDILRVDNQIVGFTIWATCIQNPQFAYVLFEKANIMFEGIFPTINYLCANKYFQNFSYINRQEDMGITNLRKSKLSYHPNHLAHKYSFISKRILSQLKELYIEAFPEDEGAYADWFFGQINYHQTEYLECEQRIIASCYIIPHQLKYYNTYFDSPLLVGIATKKEFQHQGYCHLLLKKTMINLAKLNIPLVYLYPVNHHFYEQFGFSLMNNLPVFTTNFDTYTPIPLDIEKIKSIYQNKFTQSVIALERTKENWDTLFQKIDAYQGKTILYEDASHHLGYVIWDKDYKHIEECVFERDNFQHYEQGMMARILDFKSFLLHMPFPTITKHYYFKLTDSFLPHNEGIFHLYLENGKPLLETSTHYDEIVSIEEFTKALFIGNSQIRDNSLLYLFTPQNVFNQDKY